MAALAREADAPLFDRDNKCYHECEAQEYEGNILQTDKGVMDRREERLQKHSWSQWNRQPVVLERFLLSGPLSPVTDSR